MDGIDFLPSGNRVIPSGVGVVPDGAVEFCGLFFLFFLRIFFNHLLTLTAKGHSSYLVVLRNSRGIQNRNGVGWRRIGVRNSVIPSGVRVTPDGVKVLEELPSLR